MSEPIAALHCPDCGAPVDPQAASCAHCAVELHPLRCPWCFGWTFAETADCARCGARVAPSDGAALPSCPACRVPLATRALGRASLSGCAACTGVWADPVSFQIICADRSEQAAYLGDGSALPAPRPSDPQSSPIVYRPCPVCAELMNRFNFADCSGVILDVCKPHGVWFDPDELRRIVAFIRAGGLDVARARERRKLEIERGLREQDAFETEGGERGLSPRAPDTIAAARALLNFLGRAR